MKPIIKYPLYALGLIVILFGVNLAQHIFGAKPLPHTCVDARRPKIYVDCVSGEKTGDITAQLCAYEVSEEGEVVGEHCFDKK